MISLKGKKQAGFTVIETLIVIVIIGILVTLVVVTYTGINQRNRNMTRQTDIDAIDKQLEAYNANQGYYPTLAEMNSQGWVTQNLKGLNLTYLEDPQGTTEKLVSSPQAKAYAYQPTDDEGNACDDITNNCTKFTLTATFEGTVNGSPTYVKTSD
jgi:prepilin-type N-terminal cleavage/methylation domain-containing protein